MEVILTIILVAIGLWVAFKIFVWGMVLLRILFQLCITPIVLGALTWWIWDNKWIGIIIGGAIVLYLCIKDGGIGWIFDSDGSSSGSSVSSVSSVSNISSSRMDSNDRQMSTAAQTNLNNAEYYKREYENYRQKAEEALREAEINSSYADSEANKASLYNDSSYRDKERQYRSWANQYANESKAYADKAEYYYRLAEDAINTAKAYM